MMLLNPVPWFDNGNLQFIQHGTVNDASYNSVLATFPVLTMSNLQFNMFVSISSNVTDIFPGFASNSGYHLCLTLEMIVWIKIQLSCLNNAGLSMILIFLQFFDILEKCYRILNLISGSMQSDCVSRSTRFHPKQYIFNIRIKSYTLPFESSCCVPLPAFFIIDLPLNPCCQLFFIYKNGT